MRLTELDYADGGTPPRMEGWTWWSPLSEADPQKQPRRPTLIEPDGLREFSTVGELAAALAERLGGRTPVLKRTVASYPDFDTFPAFSVYAQAQGAMATAAQLYLGCAAVQRTDAASLEAAIFAASIRAAA